jgi:hypothetical protein
VSQSICVFEEVQIYVECFTVCLTTCISSCVLQVVSLSSCAYRKNTLILLHNWAWPYDLSKTINCTRSKNSVPRVETDNGEDRGELASSCRMPLHPADLWTPCVWSSARIVTTWRGVCVMSQHNHFTTDDTNRSSNKNMIILACFIPLRLEWFSKAQFRNRRSPDPRRSTSCTKRVSELSTFYAFILWRWISERLKLFLFVIFFTSTME